MYRLIASHRRQLGQQLAHLLRRAERDPDVSRQTHVGDDLRPELFGARQAIRIRRWRRPTGKPASIEVVYYLTTLPATVADPDDLARLIRGHWSIEGRLHLVRDSAFNEDHHRARTGNAPQNLAVLRNTAITLHRQNGATGIQPALRAGNRKPERLLATT